MTAHEDSIEQIIARRVEAIVLEKLAPVLDKLAEAAGEVRATLAHAGQSSKAPSAKGSPAKTRTRGPRGPKRASKRAPRGSLPLAIAAAMREHGGPITLAEIRDKVLQSEHYRGANPKGIYTQIVSSVKKVGAKKTPNGYVLSASRMK